MTEAAIFAGHALRRLRKREGLTQAAMAQRLDISPSYLNLIERNQRPLTARVIMRAVEAFDFDPRLLREDESIGGVDGLMRRFADERFADLGLARDDAAELLAAAPAAAAAFARLFDTAGRGPAEADDPLQQCRREIERWRNHFADLDTSAEHLADELRLSRAEIGPALAERLRERHQLTIRILPAEVMGSAVRRLDLHARQLQLSEMLDPSSRTFHVAQQLAVLEQGEAIANFAAGPRFADGAARQLFERHLTGYFAAGLIMPYGRFLRACDATGYDIPVLMRRFNVSFEQLAHRLTTLQRVGQRGLPFFMARIDRAGQVSKRFAGASGATLLESEATCPLWELNRTFEQQSELRVQAVLVDGAEVGRDHWLTMSRTVGAGAGSNVRFAVTIGIEAKLADQLAHARGVSLRREDAVRIGPGCARCHIRDCRQRSLPPRGATLSFDRLSRGGSSFTFGEGGTG
ncbi:helix-turn-helix domain-containing protein [Altererythrobacter sp. H2]|uniref:helix-turn-helix domain-containing protein n=1 Tax=Altererythrobacter sp. H2 TaxID=3108391 RepID=UPI003A5D0497